MENNAKQGLLDQLLRSRQNILFLSISTKGRCDERCQLSLFEKLLPEFWKWIIKFEDDPTLGANTLTTFICTPNIERSVVAVGNTERYVVDFNQKTYLVKSKQFVGLNLHLLKTTSNFMEGAKLNELLKDKFHSIVLLDFYNWCQYDFMDYIKDITIPKSIAMMDGFNKVVFSERHTRDSEISNIRDEYGLVNEHIKDGKIDKNSLAHLLGVKSTEREILANKTIENVKYLAFNFGISGSNLWEIFVKHDGKFNMTLNHANITIESIKKDCVLFVLQELLDRQEWSLFEKVMPNWEREIDRLLEPLKKEKITAEKFNNFCSSKLSKEFANIVVNHLKKLLNND